MKQVWKFEIHQDETPTEMPEGAEIISVGFQGQQLMLWALVDVDAQLIPRHIIIRGTGHNILYVTGNLVFIGTAPLGDLVFHVFEII